MRKPATSRDLSRETEAAKILREQLTSLGDEQLIQDTIEGETSLFEIIESLVKSDLDDEYNILALQYQIAKLKDRKERIEKRYEIRRSMIQNAMDVAGMSGRETPFGTISTPATPPSVIVTDEAAIPSGFWRAKDPVLDKKLLLASLKARKEAEEAAAKIEDAAERAAAFAEIKPIPGAILSNGGRTIKITRD